MSIANQRLPAIGGPLVRMAVEQGGGVRLDGMRQQRLRGVVQNLRQRIGKSFWLLAAADQLPLGAQVG